MSEELTTRLAAHPFLAGLDARHQAILAGCGTPASFRPGERIFAEGGPADRFWLIESGTVALDMRVPGRGDQVVETLTGGTVLGWSWLQRPYRWHFGAVARATTTAVAFDAAAVRRRCDEDNAFGCAIMRRFAPVIIDRLQATRLRMLDLYAAPNQVGRP
jgi:CRP-like cAMP-binding protein